MIKILNVLIIGSLTIVLSACSSNLNTSKSESIKNTLKPQLIKVEEVASLQVVGGLYGKEGSPLYLNTEQGGKTTLTKIVGWINSSNPVDGQTKFGKHGYPMYADLKMNGGKLMTIEPAYSCTINSDLIGNDTKSCSPVKGELVLSIDSNEFRVKSPELSEWLEEGWKQDK